VRTDFKTLFLSGDVKMFNRFVKNTCAALTASFALYAGSAQAVPFLWSDDFNPADPVVSSQPSPAPS
jgi:hypothetical protein